jgi:hypothetical protein
MPHEKAPAPDFGTVDSGRFRLQAEARAKGLDPLVKYMIFHWALGALGGALSATALLVFDPFGLWPLIHDSGLGVPAIFLLYVGFMTLLGGLVCAAAVMFPPKDDDPPRGGLRGNAAPASWEPRLGYARAARRI